MVCTSLIGLCTAGYRIAGKKGMLENTYHDKRIGYYIHNYLKIQNLSALLCFSLHTIFHDFSLNNVAF